MFLLSTECSRKTIQDVKSDCFTSSAYALSSCLQSPDASITKFLLDKLNEPQESLTSCSPSPGPFRLNVTQGLCHTSPFPDVTVAPYTSSVVILVRPSTQKINCISLHTVKIRVGLTHHNSNIIIMLSALVKDF